MRIARFETFNRSPMEIGRAAMRASMVMMGLMLAGCAAHPPASQGIAEKHLANLEAAHTAGYQVISSRDGSSLFCAPTAETGSHIAPGCLNETAWARRQFDLESGLSPSAQTLSGRPQDSGSLGR
jgi:hypothetical protein